MVKGTFVLSAHQPKTANKKERLILEEQEQDT
jgi:hypothetical protein